VSSQPGQWTSVRIYLPASRKRLIEGGSGNTDLIGNQTILFVDDEELLLATGQAILSSFGYRVLTASSGAQALELIAKGDATIDLVITDLVMPRMTGRELMEQIQLRSPGMPILCTSGCMPAVHEENEAFLAKPFSSHDLLRRVKQMLA
jgi:CheY-like chemotaxis protein